jgi:hypothetical protein
MRFGPVSGCIRAYTPFYAICRGLNPTLDIRVRFGPAHATKRTHAIFTSWRGVELPGAVRMAGPR